MTRANGVIDGFEPADAMGRQRQEIARELATDIDRYNDLLDASKQRINVALAASATSLTSICGVGPICAAMIIGESGNIERFSSKHHCASCNATVPVEASSGPKARHRLDRKVAEGKTSKEAIRALKRRLSDVIFRHLVADAGQHG